MAVSWHAKPDFSKFDSCVYACICNTHRHNHIQATWGKMEGHQATKQWLTFEIWVPSPMTGKVTYH